MTGGSEPWRLGHQPALDGLRGIAVLLVLVTHTGLDEGTAGGIGVAVFFTLSGFLITTLLIEEYAATGRILLGRFWFRRAGRLLPALLVAVALSVVVEWAYAGGVESPLFVVAALTYWTNYAFILAGAPDFTLLGHTWSLAVEEQFYIVWPLVMLALVRLRRRWVLRVMAWAVVLGVGATVAAGGHAYHGLDGRAGGLLIGCALAWVLHHQPDLTVPRWVLWVGLAGIGACAVQTLGMAFEWLLAPNLVAIATVAVIWAAVSHGSRLLEWGPLVVAGERSYGIYLYHPVMFYVAGTVGLPEPVAVMFGLLLTWLVAAVSFRWVEMPVRVWSKARTRQQERPVGVLSLSRQSG